MLACPGCRGTCEMLGSFLYLLFYTQRGPDLTLENFKAGYLICCYSSPWNARIKEDKRLKVKGMRELKNISVESLELSYLRAKVNSAAHCGLQLYAVPAWDASIIGFQWFPSYLFCSAEKKGENLVHCWYISTLQFAAFSVIFHVVIKHHMSSTFHPGLFDCFSNINLPGLISPSL